MMRASTITSSLSIHQFLGLNEGPKFLVMGSVHGNESCGTSAIHRIIQEISSGIITINCGALTLLPIANPLAYKLNQREGERNLNRNMIPQHPAVFYEDKITNLLCPLLRENDVLLDLHSFRAQGKPFALIGPCDNDGQLEPFSKATAEAAFARSLGVNRFVEGWLSTYEHAVNDRLARGLEAQIDYGVGTTEAMRRTGGIAVTLECGQHDDPSTEFTAYNAMVNALYHLGMVDLTNCQARTMSPEVICLYRVEDKLYQGDQLSKSWCSFDEVKEGEVIATRQDGTPLFADENGWIVFPNAQAQCNQEWFYLAKRSDRIL